MNRTYVSPLRQEQVEATRLRIIEAVARVLARGVTELSVPAVAQVPDHVTDVLRRIFASAEFAPQRFGPARWIENGTAYTTVEKSASISAMRISCPGLSAAVAWSRRVIQ